MAGLTAACVVLAELIASALGTRSVVEPVTLVIAAGLGLRTLGWVPAACDIGIRRYETALKAGIVLLGLGLTFSQTVRLGGHAIAIVLLCLASAPVLIYALGRKFGIAQNLAILIGVGTTICGSTAIAIAAPAIEARDEEVSYAIGTISLFGILTMLALPLFGAAIGMSDTEFGIWAGTAVPATPQVIGAASIFGAGAIAQATVVKMTRNVFMIPALFVIGLWAARRRASGAGRRLGTKDYWKAVPAFLFGFLGLAILRSLVDHFGVVPQPQWEAVLGVVTSVDRWLILIAMAGIGLNTRLAALRTVGRRPLVVGFLGAGFLGALSYALIRGLGLAG